MPQIKAHGLSFWLVLYSLLQEWLTLASIPRDVMHLFNVAEMLESFYTMILASSGGLVIQHFDPPMRRLGFCFDSSSADRGPACLKRKTSCCRTIRLVF